MTTPSFLTKLLNDPPPQFAFEISEAGLAMARMARPPQTAFQPLDEGVIAISPVHNNVQDEGALTGILQAAAPNREKKRQRAAVILPDHCVRVSVLDFDAFPSDPKQQIQLIRFRIKKSLPFDVEDATISFFAQPNEKRVDVVVAVAPIEILAHYETPFRTAGFHPGLMTTSMLCALELVKATGPQVVAKLTGKVLTLAVLDGSVLKLLRSIELSGGDMEEVASHLYPTFAYMEDQLGKGPEEVLTCGFGRLNEDLAREIQQPCVPVRSQFGMPDQFNAGLLGYLESVKEFQ